MQNDNFILDILNLIRTFKLGKNEKENYLNFRTEYNANKDNMTEYDKAVFTYALLCFSFNNQISFNKKGEFNCPSGCGRSAFTNPMCEHLMSYAEKVKQLDIQFYDKDFSEISINKDYFYYADPPYLITTGAYERDSKCCWNVESELRLYKYLECINNVGAKFALSNVFTHKGKRNNLLEEWCAKNGFKVEHLQHTYKSCNYQTHSSKDKNSDEVLIMNY